MTHRARRREAGPDVPSRKGGDPSDGNRDPNHHQQLLREVNDRIAELAGRNGIAVSVFVCECSDLTCADAVEISAADYARIKAEDSHYVVLPGHEDSASQRVVARTGRFVVVANRAAEEAQETSEGRRDG
jgi:hypothetical protein